METISFYRGARRKLTKTEEDKYEDFYGRTFGDADVEQLLAEGGGADLQAFKEKSKGKISHDLWEAMFDRTVKKAKTARKTNTLGQAIFIRKFEDPQITINKSGKVIVKTGQTIDWEGKMRKGGQYLPKDYLTRKR